MKLDHDRAILGGVCAGIARHLDVDPIWVRLAFFCAFWFFGIGPILYLLLLVLMA
jgi:phage shock protein PspC (stress-responsive transcriptional regulator)